MYEYETDGTSAVFLVCQAVEIETWPWSTFTQLSLFFSYYRIVSAHDIENVSGAEKWLRMRPLRAIFGALPKDAEWKLAEVQQLGNEKGVASKHFSPRCIELIIHSRTTSF